MFSGRNLFSLVQFINKLQTILVFVVFGENIDKEKKS